MEYKDNSLKNGKSVEIIHIELFSTGERYPRSGYHPEPPGEGSFAPMRTMAADNSCRRGFSFYWGKDPSTQLRFAQDDRILKVHHRGGITHAVGVILSHQAKDLLSRWRHWPQKTHAE